MHICRLFRSEKDTEAYSFPLDVPSITLRDLVVHRTVSAFAENGHAPPVDMEQRTHRRRPESALIAHCHVLACSVCENEQRSMHSDAPFLSTLASKGRPEMQRRRALKDLAAGLVELVWMAAVISRIQMNEPPPGSVGNVGNGRVLVDFKVRSDELNAGNYNVFERQKAIASATPAVDEQDDRQNHVHHPPLLNVDQCTVLVVAPHGPAIDGFDANVLGNDSVDTLALEAAHFALKTIRTDVIVLQMHRIGAVLVGNVLESQFVHIQLADIVGREPAKQAILDLRERECGAWALQEQQKDLVFKR